MVKKKQAEHFIRVFKKQNWFIINIVQLLLWSECLPFFQTILNLWQHYSTTVEKTLGRRWMGHGDSPSIARVVSYLGSSRLVGPELYLSLPLFPLSAHAFSLFLFPLCSVSLWLEILDEVDDFLHKYHVPKLNQDHTNYLHSPITLRN